jgi:hypothetical protein
MLPTRLLSAMLNLQRLLWAAAIAALVIATTLATAPSASASGEEGCKHLSERVYSSGETYVEKCSGPNISPVDKNLAENKSGTGVCDNIWKYNGGSSYTRVAYECNDSLKVWEVTVEAPYCYVDGHGTAARPYAEYEYRLAGEQIYENICG